MLPVRTQFCEVPPCKNAAFEVIAWQGSEAASQLPKFSDTAQINLPFEQIVWMNDSMTLY